tara:strand:+ start:315 stop:623 length:309 start_codon:yes stop_codon:yes gene_type:complete
MKLTKLKGIAHDLAKHLDYQIWFGYFKDIQSDLETDIIKNKNSFDAMCLTFFKERLPNSFDQSRINNIQVKIHRDMTALNIKIEVKIDNNKEISYSCRSMMN